MPEASQPALLRAVQELLDALAELQSADLTEADRDLLRVLAREILRRIGDGGLMP